MQQNIFNKEIYLQYKVGTYIICSKDVSVDLTVGKKYKIEAVMGDTNYAFIEVINDNNRFVYYNNDAFENISYIRKMKLVKLNNL